MIDALLNTTTFLAGGASFMLLGFFFGYFASIYKRQIAARRLLAQQLRRKGESLRADQLNDETDRIIMRPPKYGYAMIAFGAILMAIGPYLKE